MAWHYQPKEDKLSRAAKMPPWVEMGILIVSIPGRNSRVEPYLNEFMNFPIGANDDQVDSLVSPAECLLIPPGSTRRRTIAASHGILVARSV